MKRNWIGDLVMAAMLGLMPLASHADGMQPGEEAMPPVVSQPATTAVASATAAAGIPGPQGPRGERGPAGPAGPAGKCCPCPKTHWVSRTAGTCRGYGIRIRTLEQKVRAIQKTDHRQDADIATMKAEIKQLQEAAGIVANPATAAPSATKSGAKPKAGQKPPMATAKPVKKGLTVIPSAYHHSTWENRTGPNGEPLLRLISDENPVTGDDTDSGKLSLIGTKPVAKKQAAPITDMTITVIDGAGEGTIPNAEVLIYNGDKLVTAQKTGAKGTIKLSDPSGLANYSIALGALPSGWRSNGTVTWAAQHRLVIELSSAATDQKTVTDGLDDVSSKVKKLADRPVPEPPLIQMTASWMLYALIWLLVTIAACWFAHEVLTPENAPDSQKQRNSVIAGLIVLIAAVLVGYLIATH